MARSSTYLLGVAVGLMLCLPWVRVNLTASAPRGLWALHSVPSAVKRGMWVTLPTPVAVQAFGPAWSQLLKPVAAVAGDTVCSVEQCLFVNGTWYGLIYQEAHGMALPQIEEGCDEVPEGRVFLASPQRRTMDGRYWGFTALADITAIATPLWTWR